MNYRQEDLAHAVALRLIDVLDMETIIDFFYKQHEEYYSTCPIEELLHMASELDINTEMYEEETSSPRQP